MREKGGVKDSIRRLYKVLEGERVRIRLEDLELLDEASAEYEKMRNFRRGGLE